MRVGFMFLRGKRDKIYVEGINFIMYEFCDELPHRTCGTLQYIYNITETSPYKSDHEFAPNI